MESDESFSRTLLMFFGVFQLLGNSRSVQVFEVLIHCHSIFPPSPGAELSTGVGNQTGSQPVFPGAQVLLIQLAKHCPISDVQAQNDRE